MDRLISQHPEILENLRRQEEITQRYIAKQALNANRNQLPIITIPVVFHVVHKNTTENISFDRIEKQMAILNEDFRRYNPDTTDRWSQAADSRIEFCLAKIDPEGNPTNGVTRHLTTEPGFTIRFDEVRYTQSGGYDGWPDTSYLNVWVCDLTDAAGYGTFPIGFASNQGIVLAYSTVGDTYTNTFGNRTMSHEVGHYLNLRHVWGDGGCLVDDFVNDTPISDRPNYGCPRIGEAFHCDSDDMVENYMDYTSDFCKNLFTEGQVMRMRALFQPGGLRESLLRSNKCCPQTCELEPSFSLSLVGEDSIQVNVAGLDEIPFFHLRYGVAGTNNFASLDSLTDSVLVFGPFSSCTEYDFQLSVSCDSLMSPFSCNKQYIKTENCCVGAVATFNHLLGDSAEVLWSPSANSTEIQLRYRPTNSTFWSQLVTSDTFKVVNNLANCWDYEYQYRTQCGNLRTRYSEMKYTPVENCPDCKQTSYPTPIVRRGNLWVGEFTIGDNVNTYSSPPPAYTTQTNYYMELIADSTYSFRVINGGNGVMFTKIWMDTNLDGEFDPVDELLYQSSVPGLSTFGTITIPANIFGGYSRIRVGSSNNPIADSLQPNKMSGVGNFLDYCVFIDKPCLRVNTASVQLDQTEENVVITWDKPIIADQYQIEYKYWADSSWNSIRTTSDTLILPVDSLFGCTDYAFRVINTCKIEPQLYAVAGQLTTPCITKNDDIPKTDVSIYPNPATDKVKITSKENIETVCLFDFQGKLVYQAETRGQVVFVDISDLPEGIYMFRLQVGPETISQKIIKQP